MTLLKNWFTTIRPKTLFASISPVLLGTAIAYKNIESLSFFILLCTLLAALFMQIGSNLVNDYYDFQRGTDNHNRIGPARAILTKTFTPKEIKNAYLLSFLIAFVLGVYLMSHGGAPIIIIGISSLFFAYIYTGGPYPLSHFGLGEITAFLFFGPIAVWGTYYLQIKTHSTLPIIIGFGPGLISATLMAINNLRDLKSDKLAKKKTLPVLFGEKFARRLPFLLSLGTIFPIVWYIYNSHNYISSIVILLLLKFVPLYYKTITRPIDSELNQTLAKTGKFLFLYCLLFSLSIIFS